MSLPGAGVTFECHYCTQTTINHKVMLQPWRETQHCPGKASAAQRLMNRREEKGLWAEAQDGGVQPHCLDGRSRHNQS